MRRIREACAQADLFLRLPMWGGFAMAPPEATRDLPLVARRSARDPIDTRKALGLPVDRTLVLLSFGGHGLEGPLARRVRHASATTSWPCSPGHLEMSEAAHRSRRGVVEFDEQALYDAGWRYEDLVAAVDVVATKPGYGIIAECAAHQTALLYTSRGHFVEYEVLVREMPRYVRSQFIPQEALFAGDVAGVSRGTPVAGSAGAGRRHRRRGGRGPDPAATGWSLIGGYFTQVTSDQIRGMFTFSIETGCRLACARNAGRSRSALNPT